MKMHVTNSIFCGRVSEKRNPVTIFDSAVTRSTQVTKCAYALVYVFILTIAMFLEVLHNLKVSFLLNVKQLFINMKMHSLTIYILRAGLFMRNPVTIFNGAATWTTQVAKNALQFCLLNHAVFIPVIRIILLCIALCHEQLINFRNFAFISYVLVSCYTFVIQCSIIELLILIFNSRSFLLSLNSAIYQDDTQPIVSGGATGPQAQNVFQGSVHTAITSERALSTNKFNSSHNDRSHLQDVPILQPSYFDQFIRLPSFNSATEHVTIKILEDVLSEQSQFARYNPALSILNSSAFVSWDSFDVYFSVSAPPNVSGLGIATCVPAIFDPISAVNNSSSDFIIKSINNIDKVRAWNMPHIKINFTESNSAVFNVPWNFSIASISTTNNYFIPSNICNIIYFNFVAPQAGVGNSADVTITPHIKFNNLRGEGKRSLNSPITNYPNYANVLPGAQHQDVLSTIGNIASTVSNVAGTVADLANPVGLASTAGSLLTKGISYLFGQSKKDAPWMPPNTETRILPLNVDHYPGGVGPRKVVVMDIADSQYETPMEGIIYDDPKLDRALYTPGYLYSVPVPVTTPVGVLFHIPCAVLEGCVYDHANSTFAPTPQSMLSSCYQYCVGSKIYDFYVVKSVLQTVTLAFSFNPTFPPEELGHSMALRNEVVTFKEDTAKAIEAPIISPFRMFPYNCPRFIESTHAQETIECFTAYGYLTVTLINPITSNAISPDDITIIVSSRAAPDFRMFSPRVSPFVTAACDSQYQDIKDTKGVHEDDDIELPQQQILVQEQQIPGATEAQPTVETQNVALFHDGFGQSPAPIDLARRFDTIYTFKGNLTSSSNDTVRIFSLPVHPMPVRNYGDPTSLTPNLFSPNMFDVLSLTHCYYGGAIEYNLDISGFTDATVSVYYVNGVPMFTYTDSNHPFNIPYSLFSINFFDIKSPTDSPAQVNSVIHDLFGLRAKEKRSLNTNNQITLGLPCHNEFSAISTSPSATPQTPAPGNGSDIDYYHYVRQNQIGNLYIIIDTNITDAKAGSLVVDRRASDTSHWSWPIGPPRCGMFNGTENNKFVLNLFESPSNVNNKYVDPNTSLQYWSLPIGGSCGRPMYPVADTLNHRSILLDGDIESNPGPVFSRPLNLSTFNIPSVSSLFTVPEFVTQTINGIKDLPKVPTAVVGASTDLSNASNAFVNLSNTFNDILKLLYDQLLAFSNIPFSSFLSIAHYVSIMCMSNQVSVSISCFVGILCHIGLISMNSFSSLVQKLSSFFSAPFHQDDDTDKLSLRYVNIIFSFVLGALGLAFTPLKSLPKNLLKTSADVFRNINSVDTFLRNNFDLISNGFKWICTQQFKSELGKVNLGQIKPEVEQWVDQTITVLNPKFLENLEFDKEKQQQFIKLAKNGSSLLNKLAQIKLSMPSDRDINVAYSLVEKLYRQYTQLYSEHAGKFILSDLYSVPFCVWIYGSAGVGKSHLVPTIAHEFLKKLNIPVQGDPLFKRKPGSKFWDSLNKQPLLWMSDPEQDNTEEGIRQFIVDWYDVLSPIPFVPNMANISEKGRKHKFIGTFVDSNSFFSDKRRLVLSEQAFKQRRDVVMNIELSPAFLEHLKKLGIENSRHKIEDYCSHVRLIPNDEFPGFNENSHLLVKYSFDGCAVPRNTAVPFSQFLPELINYLVKLVLERRLNSAKKERMFDDLSPEKTAERLEKMTMEECGDILNVISSLVGEEAVEEVSDLIQSQAELQDEEDDMFSTVSLGDNDLCIHDVLDEYSEQYNLTYFEGKGLCFAYPIDLIPDDCCLKKAEIVQNLIKVQGFKDCSCSKDKCKIIFNKLKNALPDVPENILRIHLGLYGRYELPISISFGIVKIIIRSFLMFKLSSLIVRLIKWLCSKFLPVSQDYDRVTKVSHKVKNNYNPVRVTPGMFQDTTDIIAKSCGRIHFQYYDSDKIFKQKSSNIFGLGGTAWFVIGHTVKAIRDLDCVSVNFVYRTHNGSIINQVVPWKECKTKFIYDVHHDIAIIEHPRLAPIRNKINLFATEKQLKACSRDLLMFDWNDGVLRQTNVNNVRFDTADVEGHSQEIIYYKGFQGKGLCGSVLVDPYVGRIVGFHSVGWTTGYGGATPVTKSLIESMMQSIAVTFTDVEDIQTEPIEHEQGNDYSVVAKIKDPTMIGRISTKSKLEKSSIYACLGEPEKIIPTGTPQDALVCMEPYTTPPKTLVLPDEILRPSVKAYEDLILKEAKPVTADLPRPLTILEALEGNNNIPFFIPPMRDTSPGVPYINIGLQTKGSCFEEDILPDGRKIKSFHPKFVEIYNQFSEQLVSGVKPISAAMLFLKDERKKPTKAIRGINGCDFTFHILCLQYFLPFFAAIRQARFNVGSAIGMDISRDSFEMFKYLNSCHSEISFVDSKFITADYKNFGPTIIHQVANQIVEIIIKWYQLYGKITKQDEIVMRRLFAILLNSEHIVLDNYFRVQQGVFSGNPFTAEINTMVNNIYLRCSWMYLYYTDPRLKNVISLDNPFYVFNKYVRIVTYGDDLLALTHPELYSIYNNLTIKSFMDWVGLTFTDARKRAEMVELDSFHDVSFLKHSFSLHPKRLNTILAALDMQTITDMVCYVRGKGNIKEKSAVIAQDALRFLHGHGASTFETMRTKLVAACKANEISIDFMSWPQVDARIFEQDDDLVEVLLNVPSFT